MATRYIGKCSKCGIPTSGLTEGQNARRSKVDGQRTGDIYTSHMGNIVLDCRGCGCPIPARMVRGKFSAVHKCNARCLSSTGTVCECSCAGKNHGAGHSSSV
jgi:hypothetical protein